MFEKELGVKLAERSTRKFSLTDAGKHLQNRALQIINLMSLTEQELLEYNSGAHGQLIVGTVTIPCPLLLPKTLVTFHEMFPKVGIEIRTIRYPQIYDQLENGLIDLGIMHAHNASVDNKDFESILLPPRPMVVACRPSAFDKTDKAKLDLTFLKDKPLLIAYRLESVVTEACKNAGFTPTYASRIDDSRTLLVCASLGMGYTIVPRDWVTIMPELDLVYFELDVEVLSTRLALTWAESRGLSIVANNFMQLFLDNHSIMYP